LRLWVDSNPLDEGRGEEVTRFNEAVDQAIAESVGHFHAQVEMSRNLFLGMLGHDMRTPLNAIVATASYLDALNAGEQVSAAAARLIRSGASMQVLLDDLVDFNRAKLGLGLKVVPESIDLAQTLAAELEQFRAAHSGRQIEFVAIGDSRGHWDSGRLKQVLRNLVCNALEHGSPDTSVSVTLVGEEAEVRLEVANQGPRIDAAAQSQLFEPLARGLERTRSGDGLGLGLFIVRQIALAHGGRVAVNSCDDGARTTFAVILPRRETVTPPNHKNDLVGSPRQEPVRVTLPVHAQDSVVSASGAAAHTSRHSQRP
jgi:signal transduction histidine kinase